MPCPHGGVTRDAMCRGFGDETARDSTSRAAGDHSDGRGETTHPAAERLARRGESDALKRAGVVGAKIAPAAQISLGPAAQDGSTPSPIASAAEFWLRSASPPLRTAPNSLPTAPRSPRWCLWELPARGGSGLARCGSSVAAVGAPNSLWKLGGRCGSSEVAVGAFGTRARCSASERPDGFRWG